MSIRTYIAAILTLIPELAWAHAPIGAMVILQGVLIMPLIVSVALVKRDKRLKVAGILILLFVIINYVITAEIHAALFWISLAIPYVILTVILLMALKAKSKGARFVD